MGKEKEKVSRSDCLHPLYLFFVMDSAFAALISFLLLLPLSACLIYPAPVAVRPSSATAARHTEANEVMQAHSQLRTRADVTAAGAKQERDDEVRGRGERRGCCQITECAERENKRRDRREERTPHIETR